MRTNATTIDETGFSSFFERNLVSFEDILQAMSGGPALPPAGVLVKWAAKLGVAVHETWAGRALEAADADRLIVAYRKHEADFRAQQLQFRSWQQERQAELIREREEKAKEAHREFMERQTKIAEEQRTVIANQRAAEADALEAKRQAKTGPLSFDTFLKETGEKAL